MTVQTYLFYSGRCEEAVRLYEEVFPAEVLFLVRYKDGPPELMPEGGENLIFHATLRIGDTVLNCSDSFDATGFSGFALLTHVDTIAKAKRIFTSLKEGGRVRVPLAGSPWAARYGIVEDRFGIVWKLQVDETEERVHMVEP